MIAAEDLLAEIDILYLAIPDTSGTLRAKRFPAARDARQIADGWSFIEAIQWWDTADGVSAGRGWTQNEKTEGRNR